MSDDNTRIFVLKIVADTAAFADGRETQEIARILRATADRLESNQSFAMYQTLHDINGNDVGRAKLAPASRLL